jgi:ribosomal protein L31
MKISFKNNNKTWIQLTDGSAIKSDYLLEKSHNRLDIDSKTHKLWRFASKNIAELSSTDKRILNFNKRFNKKNNK